MHDPPRTLEQPEFGVDQGCLRFYQSAHNIYAPDVSVVHGIPSIHEYAPGKTAHTNPWMVAEVISPSGRNRDFGEKLQGYKSITSLQYMLYLEQDHPFVTLFERLTGTERWKSTDFNDSKQHLQIGAFEIQMSDLYQGLL